jgi:hypothetical protein
MKIAPQCLGIATLASLLFVGIRSDRAPDLPRPLEEAARQLRIGMSYEEARSLMLQAGGKPAGVAVFTFSSNVQFRDSRGECLSLGFALGEGTQADRLVQWKLWRR